MGRGLQQAVPRQPLAGARVQLRAFGRGQRLEARRERGARQRMQAEPTLLAGDEHRRLAHQPVEPRCGIGRGHQRAAQRRMQVLHEADAHQEVEVARIEAAQEQCDELFRQRRRTRGRGLGGAAGGIDREGQLQPQRPALRLRVQACHAVAIEGGPEPLFGEPQRFLQGEAQVGRADARALAVGHQVVQGQIRLGPGRHHALQVGGRIAHEVADGFARRRRQAIGLVDHQHQLEGALRDFGQPQGDALEPFGGTAFQQHVAEAGAAGAHAHRQRQAAHQPLELVARLRAHPRDRGAAREVLQPPLREQRGLAETGRRLHQHRRPVAQRRAVGGELLPREQPLGHPRGRDFQQQVADAGGGLGHASILNPAPARTPPPSTLGGPAAGPAPNLRAIPPSHQHWRQA